MRQLKLQQSAQLQLIVDGVTRIPALIALSHARDIIDRFNHEWFAAGRAVRLPASGNACLVNLTWKAAGLSCRVSLAW